MKLTRFKRRRVPFRSKVIHSLAVSGHLSKSSAVKTLDSYYPNIHDGFTELEQDKSIINSHANFKKRGKPEKYFKLTGKGLSEFIEQVPCPSDFSKAMVWFCGLNKGKVKDSEFEKYWNSYVERYIGSHALKGFFSHPQLLENIIAKWYRDRQRSNHLWDQYRVPHRVLQCLAVNPSITLVQICEKTQLSEHDVRKTLDNYSISQETLGEYAALYEMGTTLDRAESLTYDYIQHFMIVGKTKKEAVRYELSLVGVLLVLSIIIYLFRAVALDWNQVYGNIPDPLYRDLAKYYNTVTFNYKEKLPLIFGPLSRKLRYYEFANSTLYNIFFWGSEIFSLSILLGGNKEIYDNLHWATWTAFGKLDEIYRSFTSLSRGDYPLRPDYPDELIERGDLWLIEKKLRETRTLLKYSSIQSLARYITKDQSLYSSDRGTLTITLTDEEIESLTKAGQLPPSPPPPIIDDDDLFSDSYEINYEEELAAIENIFTEEFTILFYVGLLRYNNDTASLLPYSRLPVKPSPSKLYPVYLLKEIMLKDPKIKEKMEVWLSQAQQYHKEALNRMEQISKEMNISMPEYGKANLRR